MTYLLIQMGTYLLVATCFGMLLGYCIQGIKSRKRENYWSQRFAEVERADNLSSVEKSFQRVAPELVVCNDISISKIAGPTSQQCLKLNQLGINNVFDLLTEAKEPMRIIELAEKISVDELEITRWARRADIMRVPGIEGNFSKLLEASGVCSAQQLSNEDPQRLVSVLKMQVEKEGSYEAIPDVESITKWVEKANDIKKVANS